MDDELVRTLLKEQFPDLVELELREVDGGWGNQMWRLGDDLAIRMPRHEDAPDLLTREHRWVPELAARLPLPVPTPLRLAEPSDRFPCPWLITTWVPGEAADRSPISTARSADVLAGFLQALHTEAPADAPVSVRSSLPRSLPWGFDNLPEYVDHADDIRAVVQDALAAPPWDGVPLWLHGDLHPANVVVADGTLAGVIDLEEVCAGDPANDLAAAWILLPDGAADRFFQLYETDQATVRRARGWAVHRAMFLVAMGINGDQGLPGGKAHWGPIGRAALARLTAA
ncbi:aminoglycoside phosphotransferase family protein [Kribbella solani]|uniref:Aminoglycoside phosphotransferase (APT) family kinase protein n=1 Tax=Kribbella solani TaxID=236067 RepID=A0A841E418_9ACTN|nr:aminoglycoside phosphotransferase family protein [Kribbella solani]MBB5983796.1 aminoglycoside phosphotransferase (APT) family kinase protein [Kribbella solani]